ncbi:MAG: radical SAM protein [Thermoplasmatota archaeon]
MCWITICLGYRNAMKTLPIKKYFSTMRYAYLNYLAHENIYPFYASFKVTHKCSLQCKFCNVWMEKTKDLSKQKIFKVLDELANSSIIVLSLEGGDPLMRKDLGEILEYAYTKPFYLFFTTNGDLLDKRPMNEYGKYIDYLHISIDEDHKNLEYFDRIKDFQSYGPELCIQTVVTKETLHLIEEKVKKVHQNNARIVIMPATHLEGTDNYYPDPSLFRDTILRLKKQYPNTIINPNKYLDNINKPQACSSSSIIIDSDGELFYPCRTVGKRLYNFNNGSFMKFLQTKQAQKARQEMKSCSRCCGWYQYFATDAFLSPRSFLSSLRPFLIS